MRPQVSTISAPGNGTPIMLDIMHAPFNISLFCVVTGTVNYTVQHTGDDIMNTAASSCTWFPHDNADLVNATTNQNDNFSFPVTATRIVMNSGTGSVTLTVIQAGVGGGPT